MHFYYKNPEVAGPLQEIAAAAVKNFSTAAREWFHEDVSERNFCLLPLAFISPSSSDAIQPSRGEKRFLRYLVKLASGSSGAGSEYCVAVKVRVHFERSDARGTAKLRLTSDPSAPAVYLTEEEIRKRYLWDYRELTRQCVQRYPEFKIDRNYHQLRKKLESDPRYGHVRLLDPANPKSSKKPFFSPEILVEFDKHYKRQAVSSRSSIEGGSAKSPPAS